MILFKKWAKRKVKSQIYCLNQYVQEWQQKQYFLFNLCNIFDLLTSRIQKIAQWPEVFRLDFYIFSCNNNSGKCKEISLTSIILDNIG